MCVREREREREGQGQGQVRRKSRQLRTLKVILPEPQPFYGLFGCVLRDWFSLEMGPPYCVEGGTLARFLFHHLLYWM